MKLATSALPAWAAGILTRPGTQAPLVVEERRLRTADGEPVGIIEEGIARFTVAEADTGIAFYRGVGGARFHERAGVAYAMTTLDTEVYHGYLAELRPDDPDALVVDVGGGDGRNALPWLRWGFRRIVVVDPVHAALARLRARVTENQPDWLDRLLLIEADARQLPIRTAAAARVQAIEALAYLNEDYAAGLRDCVRVLAHDGRLLIADRDYEAGLLTRLFYGGGIRGMLEQADGRDIWDGTSERVVRSRCFTAAEFAAMMQENGLHILSQRGISALSLILGHQRAGGRLDAGDEAMVDQVHALLGRLGRSGAMRRSHVVFAEHAK